MRDRYTGPGFQYSNEPVLEWLLDRYRELEITDEMLEAAMLEATWTSDSIKLLL